MRCPGQDWSQWTGEFAFETPCPKCDAAVEFFRDETSGRCPKCGHRFQNPRISFDCAKWCSFAEECLGFVPEREVTADPGEGTLAGRLIRAVKDELDADPGRIARALAVFHQARELLSKEGGDPRIVLGAALLLEVAAGRPGRVQSGSAASTAVPSGSTPAMARARLILAEVGLDQDLSDCICHVVDSLREGRQLDTIEFRVVSDSTFLAKMGAARDAGGDPDRLLELAEERLRTESGRQRARRLLRRTVAESSGQGETR
jgi:hypothetical protein